MFRKLGPIPSSSWPSLSENPYPFAGLATSLPGDLHYAARVEGKLPENLRGTLVRNGPGLFDRGGQRKRMILDGDGALQSFRFDGKGVDFRACFIRTPKFEAEEKAGRFLFPTWSTLSPGGWWRNLGGRIPNQAGVTVVEWAGHLYAFDEGQRPVEIDRETLATKGEVGLVPDRSDLVFQAHWKWDVGAKGWLPLAVRYGRTMTVEAFYFDPEGRVQGSRSVDLPRTVYIHDWFVTENFLVFLLHPGFISLPSYLKLMAGAATFAESVKWKPKEGNLIVVADRKGIDPPRFFETDALWMWHSANAYEVGNEIHCDFVGDPVGGGIGTDQSGFYQIMMGQPPKIDAEPASLLYRYRIDLDEGKVRRETLADGWNFEMPYLSPLERAREHRYTYLTRSDPGQLFWSAVVRYDTKKNTMDEFHFGEGSYCTEPVFVPKGTDGGWLLTLVYEHSRKRSHLAILDAERVADGPLARAYVEHALPLSFHGCFY